MGYLWEVVAVLLMGVEDHQEGEQPLGGDGGPLGGGGSLSGSGPPSGEGPSKGVEVEFRLEVQVCLFVLLGQVPLGTHGTHCGIRHLHPLPLWLFHQGNHYRTQCILLGQIQMLMFECFGKQFKLIVKSGTLT